MLQVVIGSGIGVIGALLGALVQAHLSGQQLGQIEQRRRIEDSQRRSVEVMAAARLVLAELGIAAMAAGGITSSRELISLMSMPTTAWATHGALLAGALPEDAYDSVAEAAAKVASVIELVRAVPPATLVSGGPADGIPIDAVRLVEMCRRAQDALRPFAYPESAARAGLSTGAAA